MPTPFYHLSVAEQILDHEQAPGYLGDFLRRNRRAFLLGNTAPDVQVVSNQPRQATHFYDLPLKNHIHLPWDELWTAYPPLAHPANLPDAQAAFLAGYICHLQADWHWVKDIFIPVFGLHSKWSSFPQRMVLHNVLRAYLDRQILPILSNGLGYDLRRVELKGWLPFVEDRYLLQWRDDLAGQLHPGAATRTVEVFAERQHVSLEIFTHLLDSEDQMESEVFSHVSRATLEKYRNKIVALNLKLLENYLEAVR